MYVRLEVLNFFSCCCRWMKYWSAAVVDCGAYWPVAVRETDTTTLLMNIPG